MKVDDILVEAFGRNDQWKEDEYADHVWHEDYSEFYKDIFDVLVFYSIEEFKGLSDNSKKKLISKLKKDNSDLSWHRITRDGYNQLEEIALSLEHVKNTKELLAKLKELDKTIDHLIKSKDIAGNSGETHANAEDAKEFWMDDHQRYGVKPSDFF